MHFSTLPWAQGGGGGRVEALGPLALVFTLSSVEEKKKNPGGKSDWGLWGSGRMSESRPALWGNLTHGNVFPFPKQKWTSSPARVKLMSDVYIATVTRLQRCWKLMELRPIKVWQKAFITVQQQNLQFWLLLESYSVPTWSKCCVRGISHQVLVRHQWLHAHFISITSLLPLRCPWAGPLSTKQVKAQKGFPYIDIIYFIFQPFQWNILTQFYLAVGWQSFQTSTKPENKNYYYCYYYVGGAVVSTDTATVQRHASKINWSL